MPRLPLTKYNIMNKYRVGYTNQMAKKFSNEFWDEAMKIAKNEIGITSNGTYYENFDEIIILAKSIVKDIEREDDSGWEERTQETLEEDSFKCIVCHNYKRLVIHHINYNDYVDPQINCLDYKHPLFGRGLVTLCDTCHEHLHLTFGRGYSKSGVTWLIMKVNQKLRKEEEIKNDNKKMR